MLHSTHHQRGLGDPCCDPGSIILSTLDKAILYHSHQGDNLLDIDYAFSNWITKFNFDDSKAVLNTQKLTLEAINLIYGMSTDAVDRAVKTGTPITLMMNAAFMSGINIGFLYREYLAQMEDLPL